jgi:hypothetical protein
LQTLLRRWCARVIGGERDQRLQRGARLVRLPQEVERDRLVVAELAASRIEPDRLREMRQRGAMIAEPRIDAAHRVEAQRIGGQRLLGFAQQGGGIAVPPDETVEPGELGPI